MNGKLHDIFHELSISALQYQSKCVEAYRHYADEFDRAKNDPKLDQYKSPDSILKAQDTVFRLNARNSITRAREWFRSDLQRLIPELKQQLHLSVMNVPSDNFVKTLRLYRETGLQPSRVEVESLIELAGKSILCYKAINKLLEQTGSPLRLEFKDFSALSDDLDELDRFASSYLHCCPVELHQYDAKVWAGQQKDADGSTWDPISSVDLLTANAAYEHTANRLNAMGEIWQSVIAPDPEQLKIIYSNNEEQFRKDFEETADPGIIEDHSALAVELAKQKAQEENRVRETLEQYK